MIKKLKIFKSTLIFLLMGFITIAAMIACFLLSFLDEKAYEETWETFFINKSK